MRSNHPPGALLENVKFGEYASGAKPRSRRALHDLTLAGRCPPLPAALAAGDFDAIADAAVDAVVVQAVPLATRAPWRWPAAFDHPRCGWYTPCTMDMPVALSFGK